MPTHNINWLRGVQAKEDGSGPWSHCVEQPTPTFSSDIELPLGNRTGVSILYNPDGPERDAA